MLKGNDLLALAFIVLLVQRLWKQFPDGINFTFDLLSSFLAKIYWTSTTVALSADKIDDKLVLQGSIVSPIYKHTCSYLWYT